MFIDFLGAPDNFVGIAERFSTELPTSPSATPSVWIDASDEDTLTVVSNSVQSIEDKGTLGLTFTASLNKWSYNPATRILGTLPCLYYNTVAVAYLESALSPAFTGTLCTAYAIAEMESGTMSTNIRTLLSMAVDSSTTDTGSITAASILAKTNNSTSSFGGYRNNLDIGRYSVIANTPFICATRFDNNFGRAYKDNVVGSQVPALTGNFNVGHLQIGNRPGGTTVHQIYGKIGEVMLFLDSNHTDAERLHNYQYLARKWGFL